MIISRTPLRISFFGGGTDMPAFYKNHGTGSVLSTAIDKYIYIIVNKKFDNKIRVSYSETEIVNSLDEVKHELVRESLKLLGISGGIEIVSISDIPSEGTGLGSSSTYTVGLLNALHAFRGEHVSAMQLAKEACEIEIKFCNKRIGKQDQYIAALGGMQFIEFYSDDSVDANPVICSKQTKHDLESQLLLVYTGKTRTSGSILTEQIYNLKSSALAMLATRELRTIAYEAKSCLNDNYLETFGQLLDKSWGVKKHLSSKISSYELDDMYTQAKLSGAIGGKILGAGGGGFFLLYAPLEVHEHILPELLHVPFKFEPQGSRIIYVEG